MADLSLYAGRWIALTENNEVASVGITLEDARHAGRVARPKERLHLAWVTLHAPHLPLPEWPIQPLTTLMPASQVWLVGGAVRDLLLDRPLHDWDFAVAGHALALARRVADALEAAYYPLDVERDAGRVVVEEPHTQRIVTLDFAGLRGKTLADDLALRDFTINAMALTLDGQLIDPTGGSEDLAQRVIRATSAHAFTDDPARLLRAARQANELGFRLDETTRRTLCAQADDIRTVAAERVRAELSHILHNPAAGAGIQLLAELGVLNPILPEVQRLDTVRQTAPHTYADAWTHTLATLAAVEGLQATLAGKSRSADTEARVSVPRWAWTLLAETLRPLQKALLTYLDTSVNAEMLWADLLKWGALFHDIGKAETATVDAQGQTHFYHHPEIGAEQTAQRLEALRFPKKSAQSIQTLVAAHMRLIEIGRTAPTRRVTYRFYRDTGEAGVAVILLALADALAVWGRKLERPYWQTFLSHAATLLHNYFTKPTEVIKPIPLLTGHDLLAMGVKEGPVIGQILATLQEAQAAGDVHTRADAEALIHTQFKTTL